MKRIVRLVVLALVIAAWLVSGPAPSLPFSSLFASVWPAPGVALANPEAPNNGGTPFAGQVLISNT
ncbi:MAG: hypothetical protein IAE81_22290, partial [Caldilineaceae bacterium]|nr:hypothetical protein [Caldilineaceae bacterium]